MFYTTKYRIVNTEFNSKIIYLLPGGNYQMYGNMQFENFWLLILCDILNSWNHFNSLSFENPSNGFKCLESQITAITTAWMVLLMEF